MACFRSQLSACLLVLACMVTLSLAYPATTDDLSSFFKPQIQPTRAPPTDQSSEPGEKHESATIKAYHRRSAEESREQPRQPLTNAGLTKPWTEPQADQPRAPEKKNRRSTEEEKATAAPSSSSTPSRASLTKPAPKPVEPTTLDKKEKRETEATKEAPKEAIVPATVPAPTTSTTTGHNTPALQSAVQPIGRPLPSSPFKRDRRGVEPAKDAPRKPAVPLPVTKPVAKPLANTQQTKPKRSADEKPQATKADASNPESSTRPPPTPAKHD